MAALNSTTTKMVFNTTERASSADGSSLKQQSHRPNTLHSTLQYYFLHTVLRTLKQFDQTKQLLASNKLSLPACCANKNNSLFCLLPFSTVRRWAWGRAGKVLFSSDGAGSPFAYSHVSSLTYFPYKTSHQFILKVSKLMFAWQLRDQKVKSGLVALKITSWSGFRRKKLAVRETELHTVRCMCVLVCCAAKEFMLHQPLLHAQVEHRLVRVPVHVFDAGDRADDQIPTNCQRLQAKHVS